MAVSVLSRTSSSSVLSRRRKQFAALLAALLLAVYRAIQSRKRWPVGMKGAPGHWLLGHFPVVIAASWNKTVQELISGWHELYGETILIHLPMQPPMIDTADPRVVEHMLKTNFENYEKGSMFKTRLADLLGDGIFNVDGAMWKSQRKTASWMFSHNKFKNHIWRVVDKNSDKVKDLLKSVKPGERVDMFSVMNRFTLDTIGEVGFGTSIGSLEDPTSPFLKAFDRAQQIMIQRFMVPGWQLFRLLGIFYEWECSRMVGLLSDYSKSIVKDLHGNLDGEAGDSFVGIFMREAAKNDEPFDEQFMKDMVLNFLIAGRDTTAQALSWCLYLVMGHPEVERKMLDEIREVCGDRAVTYDDMNNLRYLQAVIDESLRLYPSVPFNSKTTVKADTLPDGTRLPRGCTLQYNAYSMARSKKVWGEDAKEFRPERWLGTERPSSSKYPVFHSGPRECLGMRLAWLEMKTILVGMLRVVKFTLAVPRDQILPDHQLTLGMSSGLPCYVEAR